MNTTIRDLAQILEDHQLLIPEASNIDSTPIDGSACDSRVVAKNDIFVCKGAAFKEVYLEGALQSGAVAYLCEPTLAATLKDELTRLPHLVVHNIRKAMAYVARASYNYPDKYIDIVGITGTKGKSTVACMVKHIIDTQAGCERASLIGSIETFDGIERFESHNTTPEAPDLMRHVAHAKESGFSPLVMEVSSQGLKYDRVLDLKLKVACFLNISTDHISPAEHTDFEDYFSSKLKIFNLSDIAVINLDADHADRIEAEAQRCKTVITLSAQKHADYWASDIVSHAGRLTFTLHTPNWKETLALPMCGLFNVENALAACALAEVVGCSKESIVEGLKTTHVPGRMEIIHTSNPRITGLVDFAHNKLSYEKLLSSLVEEFSGYKLISIFGAPGGKALERRSQLTQIAEIYSDHIILCEEDPIHEDALAIAQEMQSYATGLSTSEVVVDRTDALRVAFKRALVDSQSKYLICLLGKGDDNWMHRGDSFDDEMQDKERFNVVIKELLG